MIRVSVIIPTRDGAGPLRTCLEALTTSFPADAETVIVIDGEDGSPETALATFVEPLRIRWVRAPRGGPARARNHGLAHARGEIVAFTDDDCRPRAGWVSALAAGAQVSAPRAVGGITLNGLQSNPYADAAQVVLDLVARDERTRFGRERFFPCNNCAFPTEPLRRLGGFNESFRTAEDRELCRRWLDAGFDLGSAPAAVVDHDPNTNLGGFLRKFFDYGRGAARFHRSGTNGSLRATAGFHVRLPVLAAPEVARRGPLRGSTLAGLLALWELANLAGFVTERVVRGQDSAPRVAGSNGTQPRVGS